MLKLFLTYVLTSIIFISAIHAQSSSKDTSVKEVTKKDLIKVRSYTHSPNLAMIFSACVPGLGQAYNKKYWKIPLVYASMGTTIYLFKYNDKYYRQYKQAYINKTDTLKSTIDNYKDFPASWLLEQEKSFRRYRDLNVILTVLAYTINVVDAYVDAQFMNFDVSDDLSMNIAPSLNFYPGDFHSCGAKQNPSAGLTLTLKF